ncbi:hypothetical protein HY989_01795 [Candidatus Micrarchaeota archaeon]|nr:hypothetical protein [Candidatus Micrarchaeota archaeon]
MAIIFLIANPILSIPCYYGSECKIKDVACVSSAYDALSVCERSKTIYSIIFSVAAYVMSCFAFLCYKLLRKDAYSYYYEQT